MVSLGEKLNNNNIVICIAPFIHKMQLYSMELNKKKKKNQKTEIDKFIKIVVEKDKHTPH